MQVKAYDVTAGVYADVSETVLAGCASLAGDVITLPALGGLEVGKLYRVEIKFTAGGNVLECFLLLEGVR